MSKEGKQDVNVTDPMGGVEARPFDSIFLLLNDLDLVVADAW